MAQPVRVWSEPYLFGDAAYFREAFNSITRTFYGLVPAINWPLFKSHFGNPQRIYYYDSIDRNQIGNETPSERDARVEQLDRFHRYLNTFSDFHVREGFVSRGRRAK